MAVDFKEQLRRQLRFIALSAAAWDAGCEDEGVRIGTCIRILLHDTKNSTSLLTHMQAWNISLLSTAKSAPPDVMFADRLTAYSGLGAVPKLGNSTTRDFMSCSDWWMQPVYTVSRQPLTRRDLVLAAANKDGGAHVDASLTRDYELLCEGWVRVSGNAAGTSMPINLAALRQLAYELLNSPELLQLAQ